MHFVVRSPPPPSWLVDWLTSIQGGGENFCVSNIEELWMISEMDNCDIRPIFTSNRPQQQFLSFYTTTSILAFVDSFWELSDFNTCYRSQVNFIGITLFTYEGH